MSLYEWRDGYWCQTEGTNAVTMQPGEGSILCHSLNEQRSKAKWDDAPGFDIKNLAGDIIYTSGVKFKIQRFYYDYYETDFGDGHYPFVEYNEMYQSYIDYYFVLDSDGYWRQESGRYIVGIDGKGKQEALAALNNGCDKGRGIKNSGGSILYTAPM
jgi:hypothetical protein